MKQWHETTVAAGRGDTIDVRRSEEDQGVHLRLASRTHSEHVKTTHLFEAM